MAIFFNIIKNFFENFRQQPIDVLIPFFLGIVIGFLFSLLLYGLILVMSLKKTEKNASNVVLDVDDEIIASLINSAKKRYIEEINSSNSNKKIEVLKKICGKLLYDIASTYYPKSKYPIYELSIDELLKLTNYISMRVDSLFKGKILKKVKNLRLSQIISLIELKKRYDENTAVKAANKVAPKASFVWKMLNIINPVYWIKRLVINGSFNAILRKIAVTIIDVVGEEASKIYSKSVFKENDNDLLEIEVQKIMEGENYEQE